MDYHVTWGLLGGRTSSLFGSQLPWDLSKPRGFFLELLYGIAERLILGTLFEAWATGVVGGGEGGSFYVMWVLSMRVTWEMVLRRGPERSVEY